MRRIFVQTSLYIVLFSFFSCKPNTNRSFTSNKETSNVNPIGYSSVFSETSKDDSIILNFYLNGEEEKILKSNFKLNSDVKIGLYSVSLLEKGESKKALEILPHFGEIEFSVGKNKKITFPYQYPMGIGFFEGYALYRNGLVTGDLIYNLNKRENLIFSLLNHSSQEETNEILLIKNIELEYCNFLLYPERKQISFSIIDSLYNLYPNFKRLGSIESACFIKMDKYFKALPIIKSFVSEEYNLSENLNLLINYYDFEKLNLDSLKKYVNLYKLKFPNIGNYRIANYYYKIKDNDRMMQECNLCFKHGQFNDSIYCKIILGEYYLQNKDFSKLRELIKDFYKHNNEIIDDKAKDIEYQEFYKYELCLYMADSDFKKYNKLLNRGNKFVRANINPAENNYYISKRIFQMVNSNDTTNFRKFYNQNISN